MVEWGASPCLFCTQKLFCTLQSCSRALLRRDILPIIRSHPKFYTCEASQMSLISEEVILQCLVLKHIVTMAYVIGVHFCVDTIYSDIVHI